MTDQPSAPSIDLLRNFRKRWPYEPAPQGIVDEALAAYDLMSQRAERLEECLRECVAALEPFECGERDDLTTRLIEKSEQEFKARTHARTVLSENKEEK